MTTQTNLPGFDANQYYHKEQNKGEVIDLVLNGLSPDTMQSDLKRIAAVKHVISSEIDVDNLKGTCRGSGRIKIRLNAGEDPETIRQNFINKGVVVKDFKVKAEKGSDFTRPNF